MQDLRVGGRAGNAQYQYTLQATDLDELQRLGAAHARASCAGCRSCVDVNSDQQNRGLQARLVIDRDTAVAPRHHAAAIDDTLYDAFGQRQVSTIYTRSTSTAW